MVTKGVGHRVTVSIELSAVPALRLCVLLAVICIHCLQASRHGQAVSNLLQFTDTAVVTGNDCTVTQRVVLLCLLVGATTAGKRLKHNLAGWHSPQVSA